MIFFRINIEEMSWASKCHVLGDQEDVFPLFTVQWAKLSQVPTSLPCNDLKTNLNILETKNTYLLEHEEYYKT